MRVFEQKSRRPLIVAAGLGAALAVFVVVTAVRSARAPDVVPSDNPFFPARGALIRDRDLLEGAAKAWRDAGDRDGVPRLRENRRVQAFWAGRDATGATVAVLGQQGTGVLARRTDGGWSIEAGARRVSQVAPLGFGGEGVLLPGNSGSRVVSTFGKADIGIGPPRLVDGMVLPGGADQSVSRGFVPPDRHYGVMTAFGQSAADSAVVAYKVGARDDERIARLVRAGHAVALYEALYPGDEAVAGGGTGIGTMRVLTDGRFGRLGHGVAVAHNRNSPANTAVSVGFDDPTRQAAVLGRGEPPFADDARPLFGADSLGEGAARDRGPFVIAGDSRIRRYEVYRGARRRDVAGPVAVLPMGQDEVTAVIGRTASGAPVLPVGE